MKHNNSETTDRDTAAILDHMAIGRPIDPNTYRRIRAEGTTITESIRRKHGVVNIAVDLVRESREEA